ncbi:MAG: DUF2336 domain-containing protein [Alphaproteobacteria bacterium]|nr:DUF2336 domain-containing protein [Alphaproteobacteria bacterium]
MLAFVKKLLGGSALDYESQKSAMRAADVRQRVTLARNSKTSKDILYYLAEKDPDPAVRAEVIKNKAMPMQATTILALDPSVDVRLALAGRLVDLLPDVSQDKHSQLYAYVVQALGTLALDEVLKIRLALSSTLKDHAHTPPKVAGQLARDVEREVSEPILRFCAALSDEDLIDILMSHPASWVIQAIAARPIVPVRVSAAVIETDDRPGGKHLIENDGAQISEDTLMAIVEKARNYPEWQKPMAMRKSLPLSIARQLAQIVDASVRELLQKRPDFDDQSTEEIAAVVRRRLDFAGQEERSLDTLEKRLARLKREGSLGEEAISDALAMRDNEFVFAALAQLAHTTPEDVKRVVQMAAAKPLVALVWRAGLPMRLALQLQKDLARIPPKELLYPKGGTDYPLTEDELRWQLEFLGLKTS